METVLLAITVLGTVGSVVGHPFVCKYLPGPGGRIQETAEQYEGTTLRMV